MGNGNGRPPSASQDDVLRSFSIPSATVSREEPGWHSATEPSIQLEGCGKWLATPSKRLLWFAPHTRTRNERKTNDLHIRNFSCVLISSTSDICSPPGMQLIPPTWIQFWAWLAQATVSVEICQHAEKICKFCFFSERGVGGEDAKQLLALLCRVAEPETCGACYYAQPWACSLVLTATVSPRVDKSAKHLRSKFSLDLVFPGVWTLFQSWLPC